MTDHNEKAAEDIFPSAVKRCSMDKHFTIDWCECTIRRRFEEFIMPLKQQIKEARANFIADTEYFLEIFKKKDKKIEELRFTLASREIAAKTFHYDRHVLYGWYQTARMLLKSTFQSLSDWEIVMGENEFGQPITKHILLNEIAVFLRDTPLTVSNSTPLENGKNVSGDKERMKMTPLEIAEQAHLEEFGRFFAAYPGSMLLSEARQRAMRAGIIAYLHSVMEDPELRGKVAIAAHAAGHPGEAAIQTLINELQNPSGC